MDINLPAPDMLEEKQVIGCLECSFRGCVVSQGCLDAVRHGLVAFL